MQTVSDPAHVVQTSWTAMAVPSNPGGVSLSSTLQQNAASRMFCFLLRGSSNFASRDLRCTDRLPTVSASQALQNLHTNGAAFLHTGIKSLDALLSSTSNDVAGGLARGKVTELWGPSGSGKTAIAYVKDIILSTTV